jgi:DNA-binding GntR family transcriptional regulator
MSGMSVYDRLRAGVVDGSLISGTRVAESVLASRLDVSRTPVREALQRLDAEGLVVAAGRGVSARRLSARELRDAYRTRAVLEGAAAESVAAVQAQGLLRPADLAGLDRLNRMTEAATSGGRFDEAVRLNRGFHRRIAELADNSVALALLDLLWDRIVVTTRGTLGPPSRSAQVGAEHRRVLSAIRSGDNDAARQGSVDHVLATAELARDHEPDDPFKPEEPAR